MHQRTLTPEKSLRIDEQGGAVVFGGSLCENSGKRSKIPGLKGERIA